MDPINAQQVFERYLYRRYGDRSTPKHYLSDLRIFLKQLGGIPIQEVSAHDIDLFVEEQHGQQLAAATINRRLATLHTFFECMAAQEPDNLWQNPVNWRRHRVKEGKPLPRDASDREVEQLFSMVDNRRDAAIFGLMVGAGLRVNEVVTLRLSDLDTPASTEQLARLRVRGKGHQERMVWVTPRWYAYIEAWLSERPTSSDDHLFLNQHGRKLSKDGVQYWLRRYCERAAIAITCHQLRHTFARRLAQQRMPIESISKLLGHSQVVTTQRYTSGADPDLQGQFQQMMAQLESQAGLPIPTPTPLLPLPRPQRQTVEADPTRLEREIERFNDFPEWLRIHLEAYLQFRWRSWKAHLAEQYATRVSCQLTRVWKWLLDHREIQGWRSLKRSDIEAWLDARGQDGLSPLSLNTELNDLRAFLHFAEDREQPIPAQLYRVSAPVPSKPLPKHLTEGEYERLVKTVLNQTAEETATMAAERAWFLTLAHTGMRANEMLDLRLADLDLASGRIFIVSAKNGKERIAFITPTLAQALHRYLSHRPATDDDHLWRCDDLFPSYEMIRRRLHNWGKLCQVSVTAHRLRHTFATRLVNRGMPLESIRKLLGHTSLQMSQHYARLYDSTVKEQFSATAAALEGIPVSDWPVYATTPFFTQIDAAGSDSV